MQAAGRLYVLYGLRAVDWQDEVLKIYAAAPRATRMSSDLTNGTQTRLVDIKATRAMATAEKANASGSSVNAAVPSPCALDPVARPLAAGSLMLKVSRVILAKFAPISPVRTTTLKARPTSAPMISAVRIASGAVS
mmetsp:Transcript_10174/g.31128  ORF Transcript_10174/g.31128 Transcript_10174/m.31128 type:complete len:136 (+) Transcript_10174:438-845(+)